MDVFSLAAERLVLFQQPSRESQDSTQRARLGHRAQLVAVDRVRQIDHCRREIRKDFFICDPLPKPISKSAAEEITLVAFIDDWRGATQVMGQRNLTNLGYFPAIEERAGDGFRRIKFVRIATSLGLGWIRCIGGWVRVWRRRG